MKEKQRLKSGRIPGLLALTVLGAFLLASASAAVEKKGAEGVVKATAKDKCPVCGMFVTKYPDWTALVLFKDGSHAFFDGPKDMFKYILDLKRYNPSKTAEDVNDAWVMDYYTVLPIHAKKAWYVTGSHVFGPMGNELIPFGKESDAKEFMKDHMGKKLLRFSDVTVDIAKALD